MYELYIHIYKELLFTCIKYKYTSIKYVYTSIKYIYIFTNLQFRGVLKDF